MSARHFSDTLTPVEIRHTGGDSVILFSDSAATPLPPVDVPQPTEPMHLGLSFRAPAPGRERSTSRPRPLHLRFADCRYASTTIAVMLVAAVATVLLVL